MDSKTWTAEELSDLAGRVVVVTGANSGLGYHTAYALAAKGAHVVLACRNVEKGREAVDAIQVDHPRASLELADLDLSDLRSIRSCAETLRDRHSRIDVLCNNAGVMALPYRNTLDGFEMQFGTNHLGHFALTGLLIDRILAADQGRVVTVSSGAHHFGRIRFDDPNWERSYSKWGAYGMSKLANLLFAFELQHRAEEAGAQMISVAAHPGYAATNLQYRGPQMAGSRLAERTSAVFNRWLAQSSEMGALPQIYACAGPDVRGGDFFGPSGLGEMRGYPKRGRPNPRARDRNAMQRLWRLSEEMTGIRYEALSPSKAA